MVQSLLGGDPSVSHFSATVAYIVPGETHKEKNERRRAQFAELRKLEKQTRYFQYKNSDEAGKASAQAQCNAYARKLEEQLGFKLEVSEGCFL